MDVGARDRGKANSARHNANGQAQKHSRPVSNGKLLISGDVGDGEEAKDDDENNASSEGNGIRENRTKSSGRERKERKVRHRRVGHVLPRRRRF